MNLDANDWNEFGGSLELIKLENHERNHLQILRGMKANQVLHDRAETA